MQQSVVSTLGWKTLRPVQEASIPPLLKGHDAIVLAPTAGGKTESAMIPLLDRLLARSLHGQPAILYLCPLKALINNLLPRLQQLAQLAGREAFAWHGEVAAAQRQGFLKEPQTVLLTTPESLQVILSRSRLDPAHLFAGLETVVIDEVHAFAGSERGDQLIALLHQLDIHRGQAVQRVGLSATVGNPEQLLAWLEGGRGRPHELVDPRNPNEKSRRLLEVHPVSPEPEPAAELFAKLMRGCAKSLLFVDSRRQAEVLRARLAELGIEALAHHSSLSREKREESETVFRRSSQAARRPQTIVCTSTLELGLDVGDVEKVFQWGAPSTVSAFLQRFGRAGRRQGAVAHMVFVTDQEESFLRALALIRLALQGQVEPVLPDPRSFVVLVQQVLIQVLRHGGLAPDRLWTQLGSPPCFASITQPEKDQLLAHLQAEGWLYKSQGRLSLGPRTEKVFGRSHFMDLLSVFSGGASVTVKTGQGRPVGTLDASMALRLWSDRSSFVLAGGSWLPTAWDANAQVLTVTASVGGEAVRWSGGKGELSFPVARQIRALLTETDPLPFLGPRAQDRLRELREQAREVDADRPLVWQTGRASERRTVIELWGGERLHRTLACAWSGWLGCQARSDSRRITLHCPLETWEEKIVQALDQEPREALEAGLRAAPPNENERAPKFCDLLPEPFRTETLWRQNYDLDGACLAMRELLTRVVLAPTQGEGTL